MILKIAEMAYYITFYVFSKPMNKKFAFTFVLGILFSFQYS